MNQKDRLLELEKYWRQEYLNLKAATSIMSQYIEKLNTEAEQLRWLLHELADAYGDEEQVETLVYEIYCEFGGEEE